MRLMLNATLLTAGWFSGLERYTTSLFDALLRLETDHEWHILLRAGYRYARQLPREVIVHRSPYRDRLRTDQLWLPRVVAEVAPDVVHFPAFAPPWRRLPRRTRVVWTIHDAVFWLYPETLSPAGKLYYRPSVNGALHERRCDLVLTISHAAAADLRKRVPACIPIRVTRNGLAEAFRPSRHKPEKYGLDKYILTVGTAEPRKNLGRLVAAHGHLRERRPETPPLVIVGHQGWGRRLPTQDEAVRQLGAVPDEDLPSLYSHCAAFVLPSMYEGFGLPLLEALACGAPCVASDIPALREVGNDACLYVPPADVHALADAMQRILDDTALAARLRAAGPRRSSHFSWAECACRTLEAYDASADAGGQR
jgi:glycosyltransferase involved in cell wall biosynthesis